MNSDIPSVIFVIVLVPVYLARYLLPCDTLLFLREGPVEIHQSELHQAATFWLSIQSISLFLFPHSLYWTDDHFDINPINILVPHNVETKAFNLDSYFIHTLGAGTIAECMNTQEHLVECTGTSPLSSMLGIEPGTICFPAQSFTDWTTIIRDVLQPPATLSWGTLICISFMKV